MQNDLLETILCVLLVAPVPATLLVYVQLWRSWMPHLTAHFQIWRAEAAALRLEIDGNPSEDSWYSLYTPTLEGHIEQRLVSATLERPGRRWNPQRWNTRLQLDIRQVEGQRIQARSPGSLLGRVIAKLPGEDPAFAARYRVRGAYPGPQLRRILLETDRSCLALELQGGVLKILLKGWYNAPGALRSEVRRAVELARLIDGASANSAGTRSARHDALADSVE